MTAAALTLASPAPADTTEVPFLPLAPQTAPDLPPIAVEAALPGRITLSHGPADTIALPAPAPIADTPEQVRARLRRRAAWGERLFHASIVFLTLLSGGVCIYRLLWMGQ